MSIERTARITEVSCNKLRKTDFSSNFTTDLYTLNIRFYREKSYILYIGFSVAANSNEVTKQDEDETAVT